MEKERLTRFRQVICDHSNQEHYTQRRFDILQGFELIKTKFTNCHKIPTLKILKIPYVPIKVRSPGFEPGSSAWEADVLPGWTKTAQTAFDLFFELEPFRSRFCFSPIPIALDGILSIKGF
jgi:hypothetical protein